MKVYRIRTPVSPFRRAGILFDRTPQDVPASHFDARATQELFAAAQAGALVVEVLEQEPPKPTPAPPADDPPTEPKARSPHRGK